MTQDFDHVDTIVENGECVYSLSWDSDAPGGAGVERVYLLDGVYAVALDDGDVFGPYQSLKEAIVSHEELHLVGEATIAIESGELAGDEIVALLAKFEGADDGEYTLEINGQSRVVKLP